MVYIEKKLTEFRTQTTKISENTLLYLDKSLQFEFSTGSILEMIYKNNQIFPLQVNLDSWVENQQDSIMLCPFLMKKLDLKPNEIVSLRPASGEKYLVDYVEVSFKKQYLSRGDLRTWQLEMIGKLVYVGFPTRVLCWSGSVEALFLKKKPQKFGMINTPSQVNFRSKSAVVYIHLQMSAEMWTFNKNGEFYYQKAVDEFLKSLFLKWEEYNCNHTVNIVYFSRILYDAKSIEDFPEPVRPSINVDDHGTFYEDIHWVLLRRSSFTEWKSAIDSLKTAFNNFEESIRSIHAGYDMPNYVISLASQGNLLETLNISLDAFDKYYNDRSFCRLGQVVVFVTAGQCFFEVSKKLTLIAMKKALILGTSIDIVFLESPPLYSCPLFMFYNPKGDNYSYYSPMWINPSFYVSDLNRNREAKKTLFSIPNMLHPINQNQQKRLLDYFTRSALIQIDSSSNNTVSHSAQRKSPMTSSCPMPLSYENYHLSPTSNSQYAEFQKSSPSSHKLSNLPNTIIASFTSEHAIDLKCSENPMKVVRNRSDPLDASNWRWRNVFYFYDSREIVDRSDQSGRLSNQQMFSMEDTGDTRLPEMPSGIYQTTGEMECYSNVISITFQSEIPESFILAHLLPPTTDYWPICLDNYKNINYEINFTSIVTVSNYYESPQLLMKELSIQRMSRDFQLVEKRCSPYDSKGNFIELKKDSFDDEYRLSDGLTFHYLRRCENFINVMICKSEPKGPQLSVDYKSHIRHLDVPFFTDMFITFSTPHQEDFHWNFLDNFIMDISSGGVFSQMHRYWKSRFAIIPLEMSYFTNKSRFLPNFPNIPKQDNLIVMILKLLNGFNSVRDFQDIKHHEVNTCKMCQNINGQLPNASEIIKAMRLPKTCFPFLPPILGKEPHVDCFTSYDAVVWLTSSPKTQINFNAAISIFQKLLNNGDIRPIENLGEVPRFAYGFHLYYLRSKNESKTSLSGHKNSRTYNQFSLSPMQVEILTENEQICSAEISLKDSLICFVPRDQSKLIQFVRLSANSLLLENTIFSLEFDWVSISGDYLLNIINMCCDACAANKFKFTPIPSDPFPLKNNSIIDPFRAPLFVPLNVEFISKQKFTDLVTLQNRILKGYGFLQVVDFVQSPTSKTNPECYYVHVTGHVLVLPIYDPSTLHVYHTAVHPSVNCPGFIWTWNLMYGDEVDALHLSSQIFYGSGFITSFTMNLLNDFQKFCSADGDSRLETLCSSLVG